MVRLERVDCATRGAGDIRSNLPNCREQKLRARTEIRRTHLASRVVPSEMALLNPIARRHARRHQSPSTPLTSQGYIGFFNEAAAEFGDQWFGSRRLRRFDDRAVVGVTTNADQLPREEIRRRKPDASPGFRRSQSGYAACCRARSLTPPSPSLESASSVAISSLRVALSKSATSLLPICSAQAIRVPYRAIS